jgi:hypothetical protein
MVPPTRRSLLRATPALLLPRPALAGIWTGHGGSSGLGISKPPSGPALTNAYGTLDVDEPAGREPAPAAGRERHVLADLDAARRRPGEGGPGQHARRVRDGGAVLRQQAQCASISLYPSWATLSGECRFKELVPHAEGPHLVTGRHFLQEDSGSEIAALIVDFLARNRRKG